MNPSLSPTRGFKVDIRSQQETRCFSFGNVLYLVVGMNHPGIVIVSLIVVFFGIAISVAASVLSTRPESRRAANKTT